MILKKTEIQELETLSQPLMQWLRNFDPHVKIIIDPERATFIEESASVINLQPLQD